MSDFIDKIHTILQMQQEYGSNVEHYLFDDEKDLLNLLDNKKLKTSLDEFELSVRLTTVLKAKKLITIEDVLTYGANNLLLNGKNFGRKSLNELKSTIKNYILTGTTNQTTKTESININLSYYIETILPSFLKEKQMQILKARYDYNSHKKAALEKIAIAHNITRERVRQIINKSLLLIRHKSKLHYLQEIIQQVNQTLLSYNGILDIDDLKEQSFFSDNNLSELSFFINLISDLFKKKYELLHNKFLCNLNKKSIDQLHEKILKYASTYEYPLDKIEFYNLITSDIGKVSKNYLFQYLVNEVKSEVVNNQLMSIGSISIDQRVVILIKDVKKPLHISDIVKLYDLHYHGGNVSSENDYRYLEGRLQCSNDFIMVGPRTFMLRKHFQLPSNIKQIIRISKSILKKLNAVTDTKYLFQELRNMDVDLDCINQYSLKHILLEYPGFLSYRKFEVGLANFESVPKRIPLDKMIYDILISNDQPMTVSEIYSEISKIRGYEKYIIDQRLGKDPRFIRVSAATYTVKENIPKYKSRRQHIIKFIREKLSLNGNSISLSVAKNKVKSMVGTDELTKGLILHVLETCPEFEIKK